MSDIDAMTAALAVVRIRCDAAEEGLSISSRQLEDSRLSLSGMRALQAVAKEEEYPLGRSLQRRLVTRLVERLKAPPPSGLNTARV